MKNTKSAGGIVLNSRGEVALVQNGPGGFWGFPKGHVDEGEDDLSAAKREITEETGLEDLTHIGEFEAYGRHKGHPDGGDDTSEYKTIRMFLFRTSEETLSPRDPGNPQARWVPQNSVEELLTSSKDRDFFRSIAARLATIG
ncbi:NUDIX hydrolase [Candidatus Kaiserbacteria bacterium]|nr:NUDIX hydrolase [Candidatus Kaiserbacteria bacterium]